MQRQARQASFLFAGVGDKIFQLCQLLKDNSALVRAQAASCIAEIANSWSTGKQSNTKELLQNIDMVLRGNFLTKELADI